MYNNLNKIIEEIAGFLWGTPLVVLLIGGGIFFTIYSRFIPFLYFKHGIEVLSGKFDSKNDPGQISHFQALSSALASTVGMGNIAGVAIAINMGGPGSIFWMWITAIIGMSTKFFTCTLAVMYRGVDDRGQIQGGVMYFIEEGLGNKFKPLANMFAISGLIGTLTFFQANQLSSVVMNFIYKPYGLFLDNPIYGNLTTGIIISFIVGSVIFGGISRISNVASKMVPFMVTLYLLGALIIIFKNINQIFSVFNLIIYDAFTGSAIQGGAIGSMIIIGVRRGLFSNEAGTGTETMAHGAARTSEPIREGLVAMLGPFIDTLIVCTITAFVILISGEYQNGETGISLTIHCYSKELGLIGELLLIVAAITFAISTMFGYAYYGRKCASYLFGANAKVFHSCFYVSTITISAIIKLDLVLNIVDSAFALMVIPTMLSSLLLAPKVMQEAKRYFTSFN